MGWGDKEPPIWILIVGLTIKLEACSAHKAGIVINYSHKAWPSSSSSFLQAMMMVMMMRVMFGGFRPIPDC